MTEKRFTINGKEIIQNKEVWCMANSEHCADVIATAMNELHEENQELKAENEAQFRSIMRLSEKINDCRRILDD